MVDLKRHTPHFVQVFYTPETRGQRFHFEPDSTITVTRRHSFIVFWKDPLDTHWGLESVTVVGDAVEFLSERSTLGNTIVVTDLASRNGGGTVVVTIRNKDGQLITSADDPTENPPLRIQNDI